MCHFTKRYSSQACIDKIVGRRRMCFTRYLPYVAAGKCGRYRLPEAIAVAPEGIKIHTAMIRMCKLVCFKAIVIPLPVAKLKVVSYAFPTNFGEFSFTNKVVIRPGDQFCHQ